MADERAALRTVVLEMNDEIDGLEDEIIALRQRVEEAKKMAQYWEQRYRTQHDTLHSCEDAYAAVEAKLATAKEGLRQIAASPAIAELTDTEYALIQTARRALRAIEGEEADG